MIGNYYYGTGRRKSAVARVFIKKGSGKIVVNEKPADEFFSRDTGRMVIRQPLKLTNHEATFDIMINVEGGGESGQAGGGFFNEDRTVAVVLNGEREELAGRVKSLLTKLEAYL